MALSAPEVVDRVRNGSIRLSASIGALAMGAMAVVSFADVVLRIAGYPITGAYELTAILVGVLVYATLPLASADDTHVRAGVLGVLVSVRPGLATALGLLRRVLSAVVLAYLAWALLGYMRRVAEAGDRAPYIELPLAWVAGFGALAMALAAWCAWVASDSSEDPAGPPVPSSDGAAGKP